jgi:hypothetical protein
LEENIDHVDLPDSTIDDLDDILAILTVAQNLAISLLHVTPCTFKQLDPKDFQAQMKNLLKTPRSNLMLLLQRTQNIEFLECSVTLRFLVVATTNPPLQSPLLTPYLSLNDVSIACHLNQKQHTIFILVGYTLLKSFDCNSSMNADVEPLYAWLEMMLKLEKAMSSMLF